MSTEPQGWQTPKTNWKAADIVHPSDFNRIEGNIQAIESGQRTLDPSQAPSENSGTLRQILSWFANRIKAILGTTNWYDTPPYTLAGATPNATANRLVARDASGRAKFADPSSAQDAATKGYVDGAVNSHANATSVHGATSSATANRLIIRDSSGRASVVGPTSASHIATKGYVDDLVGAMEAGAAYAYYLTPPNVERPSDNTDYPDWWVQDIDKNVIIHILLPGTIRYHVQYRTSTGTCYIRILRNSSQIREESTSSSLWSISTGNITVNPGDIITIQKRTTHSNSPAYWRNVRIETSNPPLGIQRF